MGMIKAALLSRYPKYLHPLSAATVERMCRDGVFKTATKLGQGKKAHWFVAESEVFEHKFKRNTTMLNQTES